MKSVRLPFRLAAAALLLTAAPALADGDVHCNAGPQSAWKPIKDLKKAAWMEGWTMLQSEVTNDCYEVYARAENGQVVEAFFHPVTMKKLVVYRRGKEVFRAAGFTG